MTSETTTSVARTLPRIALVTPVRNSGALIEQSIQSVLSQNYPNLEYFIIDGGSTDGTLDIIRKYQSQLSGWISEPDNGMYDALNKGFARTSGEIMGWISATDMLHPGGLAVVGSVFRDLPQVDWITGRATTFHEDGSIRSVDLPPRWSRLRFLAGANRYIQQESTFWRRSLWQKAGGHLDASRRIAADFELWVRFFRHAQLYPIDALIGGFRFHGDSIGLQGLDACHQVHDEVIHSELTHLPYGAFLKLFRATSRLAERTPLLRRAWSRFVTNPLYGHPAPDWPPIIRQSPNATWHLDPR
ncbi:MAG TPA: glycosyltransferase family 2 protein [Candidatus Dormibacteraeota bacterium]|nr:glycosyltransferase family 2 protein [Candidatus Dormibacteraeota bacterium]